RSPASLAGAGARSESMPRMVARVTGSSSPAALWYRAGAPPASGRSGAVEPDSRSSFSRPLLRGDAAAGISDDPRGEPMVAMVLRACVVLRAEVRSPQVSPITPAGVIGAVLVGGCEPCGGRINAGPGDSWWWWPIVSGPS